MMDINAFILAGGKSSRMGTEKGLVMLDGKSFVKHSIDVLTELNLPINIISNTHLFDLFGYPVFEDVIKNKGPLSGIYTALMNSNKTYNLILSCDTPFINTGLLKFLMNEISDNSDCLVPMHDNCSEPLCAIYNKQCSDKLKMLIDENDLSVRNALEVLNTQFVDVLEQEFYSEKLFMNINSKEELKNIKSK